MLFLLLFLSLVSRVKGDVLSSGYQEKRMWGSESDWVDFVGRALAGVSEGVNG